MTSRKSAKEESNKGIVRLKNTEKSSASSSFLEKCLGDISKASATKQIFLGASSGWITGYLSMKFGKVVAISVGGGIILLQIANEKGYINVNWGKVNKKIDKIVDKVEEKITGEGSSWMDKTERFLERKVDRAEDVIKGKAKKAKRWYSGLMGDSDCRLEEIHIFLLSFCAGVAIGIATS
ncbi:FUN14 domain-containing protein 1-like [Onthophagus taurus]|uniref:FUN14 domain-containing protein 1-like n=1 Tax=Onthophagus taurus TaxID=166361 RepID=UPI000C20D364|nr:FUN14 domain-containing protein 1-like [Onthophagus taurus]